MSALSEYVSGNAAYATGAAGREPSEAVRWVMREDNGVMIDINESDMTKLLSADESALMGALQRILAVSRDDAYNSWNSTI
jgi:hypothetical protein